MTNFILEYSENLFALHSLIIPDLYNVAEKYAKISTEYI